jgi:hypothetical protein
MGARTTNFFDVQDPNNGEINTYMETPNEKIKAFKD